MSYDSKRSAYYHGIPPYKVVGFVGKGWSMYCPSCLHSRKEAEDLKREMRRMNPRMPFRVAKMTVV